MPGFEIRGAREERMRRGNQPLLPGEQPGVYGRPLVPVEYEEVVPMLPPVRQAMSPSEFLRMYMAGLA